MNVVLPPPRHPRRPHRQRPQPLHRWHPLGCRCTSAREPKCPQRLDDLTRRCQGWTGGVALSENSSDLRTWFYMMHDGCRSLLMCFWNRATFYILLLLRLLLFLVEPTDSELEAEENDWGIVSNEQKNIFVGIAAWDCYLYWLILTSADLMDQNLNGDVTLLQITSVVPRVKTMWSGKA